MVKQRNFSCDDELIYMNCSSDDDLNHKTIYSLTPNESFHSSEASIENSTHSNESQFRCSKNLSVKFSYKVKVYLIPSRDEINSILSDIYWTCEEVQLFKEEAYNELTRHSELNNCTIKESVFHLYVNVTDERNLGVGLNEMPL
jgi:hypothetical protein